MRNRTRETPRLEACTHRLQTYQDSSPCSGATFVNQTYNLSLPDSESITDALGRDRENPCEHSKITDRTPNPSSFRGTLVTTNGYRMEIYGMDNAEFLATRNAALNMAVPSNDADIFAMYSSMLPGIRSEMDESFANFVIDIPSIKRIPSLVPKVRTLRAYLSHYLRSVKKTGKGMKLNSRDFAKFLKWLANADLTFHFGVLPLIDDVQAIYRSASESQKSFNRLTAEAGRWRTKHVRFNGSPAPTVVQSSPVEWYWTSCSGVKKSSTSYRYQKLTVIKDTSCVKLRYKYRMPDLPVWLARTYAAFDGIGLNFNPKIIWDAMRLSFVCDWFVKVGTFLNQFETPALNPSVEVYSCVHSRHTIVHRYSFRSFSVGGNVICCDRTDESYKRYVGIPPMTAIQSSWGVDWFKVHIGASLLAGKVLK